jgi:hypothetical protein
VVVRRKGARLEILLLSLIFTIWCCEGNTNIYKIQYY